MKSTNIWCKMDINNRTLQCHNPAYGCDDNYYLRELSTEDYPDDFKFEDELKEEK